MLPNYHMFLFNLYFYYYFICFYKLIYILNTYVKFCVSWMLFTIRFISLFFILQNLKFKYLINDIAIDF